MKSKGRWRIFLCWLTTCLCTGLCAESLAGNRLTFWEYASESFQREGEPYGLDRRRGAFQSASFRTGSHSGRMAWGYEHDYRVFTFPKTLNPPEIGNGHVHRTGPVILWESDDLSIRMAPALSVSSNVLREQRDLAARDLDPSFSVWRSFSARGEGTWHWGIEASSRTGTYRIFPLLAWESRQGISHGIMLGFPDSRLHWRILQSLVFQIEAGPDGGVWQVRDRDFNERARLHAEEPRVMTLLEWRPGALVRFGLFVESRFARKWQVGTQDGMSHELDPPAQHVGGIRLSLCWN